MTLDLHAGQIQGFFDIPTDNLYAVPILTRDIKANYDLSNVMVVSPDVGGVVRARALAKRLDCLLAIVDKRRDRPGESEVMNIIGDVTGKDCLLIDDIVDSGGTLCNAADALLAKGATSVTAYITHGVLSGGASPASRPRSFANSSSPIRSSRPRRSKSAHNIRVVSTARLIGEAINRTARKNRSSSLFD
jgi:ribose-phosphate pyrophosphokinase